jgi:ATP-dependent DNA ligase
VVYPPSAVESGAAGYAHDVVPTVEPMLARLERELPRGPGLRYEPKWDGFRCLARGEAGEVVLTSRNDRGLTRYFPEVAEAVRPLGDVVLDGELVVRLDGRADFSTLMARLHPAASRVERLARHTPATYVVFDVLAADGTDLTGEPFAARRDRLAALLDGRSGALVLTPQTDDPAKADGWLRAPAGSGIDGVVVKPEDLRYQPGRRSMTKVKLMRTADCVVGGLRLHADGDVGSLLLGAYEVDVLHHVGVVSSFARARRAELRQELAPLVTGLEGHPWEHGFGLEGGALGRLKGTAGRWTPDLPRDWLPVRPERVAEVAYDHVEGWRFRHPGRFVRWRPDRDPRSCTVEQLR